MAAARREVAEVWHHWAPQRGDAAPSRASSLAQADLQELLKYSGRTTGKLFVFRFVMLGWKLKYRAVARPDQGYAKCTK